MTEPGLPSPPLQGPTSSGRKFALLQATIVAACFVLTALAPRAGAATLYLPIAANRHDPVMAWALANGARIAGSGPAGSLVLVRTRPGFGWRAFKHGALAIAVPEFLCTDGSN